VTTMALKAVSRLVGEELHLDDISLTMESGQLYVLLGQTSAGKTSLLRVMAGLDRPTEGRVMIGGVDVTQKSVRQRNVAMVYQQFVNYPSFTVYDNIASPLRLRRFRRAEIDKRVKETAELLHIEGLLNRLPAELSGGQQQRCAIARAVVKEADLLLLDEPLVNLDYKLREELRTELRALFARRDAIVVYATTEPMEALIMGGNVVVMGEGRALQAGPTLEVYHKPGSTRVATTFSDPAMNMVDVTVRDGQARTKTGFAMPLSGPLASLPQGRYRLGVRANHLWLQRRTEADIEITGVVDLAEISGSETFVHLRHNNLDWVVQEEGVHPMERGSEVTFYLDPQKLYVFGDTGALELAPKTTPLDDAA
jgi:glycerol transport system ATP-binding protein